MTTQFMDPDLRILIIWTVVGGTWLALHLAVLVRAWPLAKSPTDKALHVAIPVLPAWTLWKHQQRVWVFGWLFFGLLYLALRVVFR